jgi:hypothetical protein
MMFNATRVFFNVVFSFSVIDYIYGVPRRSLNSSEGAVVVVIVL